MRYDTSVNYPKKVSNTGTCNLCTCNLTKGYLHQAAFFLPRWDINYLQISEANIEMTDTFGNVFHTARNLPHYSDVMMGGMASQITSLTNMLSTVYSGADQRKYQSSAPIAFVWGNWCLKWAIRYNRIKFKSQHEKPNVAETFYTAYLELFTNLF